jgi:hydroxyethylthiazole kinase-like uncharacterized protein yjeF
LGQEEGQGRRAVVLCGPGNNGGDGFVVARLLRQRGWDVAVYLFGEAGNLPADAKVNHDRWCAMGEVRPLGSGGVASDDTAVGRVVVDALFGTGLGRSLGNLGARIAVPGGGDREGRVYRVAVDMPSGLCSDSGRVLHGDADMRAVSVLPADLTVSFHSLKLGHVLAEGPDVCGTVRVVDIGLAHHGSPLIVDAATIPPGGLGKGGGGHKYSHGHALVLSGGPGRSGAARLAARGALRVGAGLVTLAVPPAAQSEVAAQITAIMLRRVADGGALRAVLEDRRFNALCIGPGLGTGDGGRALVAAGLESGRAMVLDADALTLVANDADLFACLHAGCVLTPHGGEFARLFPDIAARLETLPVAGPAFSRVDATRAAAERAGCVVLLKGRDTVIAAPDGSCVVSAAVGARAAPWLATAGSGDVLAGFITGLLARGLAPMAAAQVAAWLHVECARNFGPGLIAEDIPEQVPAVLRARDR